MQEQSIKEKICDMIYLTNDCSNNRMYLITSEAIVKSERKLSKTGNMMIPENDSKTFRKEKKEDAANFCILSAIREVYSTARGVYYDNIIVKCRTHGKEFTVKISFNDFKKYKIKSAFNVDDCNILFSAAISDSKMNKLLYNYITGVMSKKAEIKAEKPGFWLKDEKYSYIFHIDGNEEYETESVRNARFELKEKTDKFHEILELKPLIRSNRLLNMLMLIDTVSFMYTIFSDQKHDFNKIIAVTGCDTKEKLRFLTGFFKVFDRDSEDLLSLHVKERELKRIIYSRKDEMLVFDDDASTKSRLSENIKILYDSFVKRKTCENGSAECNCLIVCNHSQTLEALENYSDGILWIDVSELNELLDHFDALIELKETVRNTIIKFDEVTTFKTIFLDISKYDHVCESQTEDTLIRALHVIEVVCDQAIKINLDIGVHVDRCIFWISEFINNSGLFYDDDYIIDNFSKSLSVAVEKNMVKFSEYEPDDNTPVVYVKNDLLLFNVKDFAELEQRIPFGLIDKTPNSNGIRLRRILCDKGYLVSNNGDKLLYKTSISDDSKNRANFVALKKNFLIGNARKMVPEITGNKNISSGYRQPDNNDGMKRIFLGLTMDTEQPVYWSIGNSQLANNHLYVQADSGSGKTTLLFLIAQRLYKIGKKVVILDFAETESYSKYKIDYMNENLIKNTGLSVFETGMSENDIVRYDYSKHILDKVINTQGIFVIRCMPSEAVEVLRDIFRYLNMNNHNHDNDIYAILDEINSLNFDEKFSEENDQSVADVIFRQGRGVGLNLVSATQFLSKKGAKNKALLFNQSATKIALHINTSASTGVAKAISVSKYSYYKEILEKQTRGMAIVYSGVECEDNKIRNDLPLQIKISPLNK